MIDQYQRAGGYEVDFISKFALSSGVYFYRIEADDLKGSKYVDSKKMVLIK
jgi:hypothetical protein